MGTKVVAQIIFGDSVSLEEVKTFMFNLQAKHNLEGEPQVVESMNAKAYNPDHGGPVIYFP